MQENRRIVKMLSNW